MIALSSTGGGRHTTTGRIPAPARPRGGAGFSLLELVITVAVLASVTLAAALVVVPIARESRLRREVETANTAAQRVLEKIQATAFNEIVTTYAQGHVEPIAGLTGGSLRVTYADTTADPLEIQVDLIWNSPEAGTISRTFRTLRTE